MELTRLKSRWGTEEGRWSKGEADLKRYIHSRFLIAMLFVDYIGNKNLINVRLTQ